MLPVYHLDSVFTLSAFSKLCGAGQIAKQRRVECSSELRVAPTHRRQQLKPLKPLWLLNGTVRHPLFVFEKKPTSRN